MFQLRLQPSTRKRLIFGTAAVLLAMSFAADYLSIIRASRFKYDVKDLSHFDFDQAAGQLAQIPPFIRELDGKRLTLTGEMWCPDADGPSVNHFDLVYLPQRSHQPVHIQDFVKCTATHNVPFYEGEVRVTGIFHVAVLYDHGKVSQVFHLDVEQVNPKVN